MNALSPAGRSYEGYNNTMANQKKRSSKDKIKHIFDVLEKHLDKDFHETPLRKNKLAVGDVVVMTRKHIKWQIAKLFEMNEVKGVIHEDSYQALTVFLGSQIGYKMKGLVTGYGSEDSKSLNRKFVRITWTSKLGTYWGYSGEQDLKKEKK